MKIASLAYNYYLNSSRFKKYFWRICRKLLIILLNNPSCTLKIHGRDLQLPLSHSLPIYIKDFPSYDKLPGRISDYIHNKYGYLKCIDVGANIGDSVAAFFKHSTDIFLAIEPVPHFNQYLIKNWGKETNVKILDFVCSSTSMERKYDINELNRGTASIVSNESGITLKAKSIDDIVKENPEFLDFNVLKIDTDGHDFEVIRGSKKVIAGNLPAVLFECFAFIERYVENFIETLHFFKNVGYDSFLIYDNYGYLMGKQSLKNLSNFKHHLFYQLTSQYFTFDILLMKEEDIDIFVKYEHSHFIDEIPNKALQKAAKSATILL